MSYGYIPRQHQKSEVKTNQDAHVRATFGSLTRGQLRSIAHNSGVKRGRNKEDTFANLMAAVKAGTLRVKSLVSISLPPPTGQKYGGRVLLTKKFRTYKPDRLLQVVPSPLAS